MSALEDTTPKRVDETWKTQVEHEQQRLKTPSSAEPSAPGAPARGAARPPTGDQRFEALISGLAMEAFIHLGDVPHPVSNRPEVNVAQAKQVIDLLGMLETKTHGNLTPQESQQLGDALYQLRMRYVEKTQAAMPSPPGAKEAAR